MIRFKTFFRSVLFQLFIILSSQLALDNAKDSISIAAEKEPLATTVKKKNSYLSAVKKDSLTRRVQKRQSIAIAAGRVGGSYFRIAKDLQLLLKPAFVEIYETNGSLSNIKRILTDANIDLALVQYDALLLSVKKYPLCIDHLKIVYPLFEEEIHLIVRADSQYKNLTDLRGKKVSIGSKKSGNWVTSKIIFNIMDIFINEYNYDQQKSFEALDKKEIDAIFMVTIAPSPFLGKDFKEKYKLLPIKRSIIDEDYSRAVLDASQYPWLGKEKIQTYSVATVLVVYDPERSVRNKMMVKRVASRIARNHKGHSAEIHPKWKDLNNQKVNFEFEIHPASVNYIKQLSQHKSITSGDIKLKSVHLLEE